MSSPVALPPLATEAQRSIAKNACSETSFKNRSTLSGAVNAIKPFDKPLRATIPRNTVPNVGLTGVISDNTCAANAHQHTSRPASGAFANSWGTRRCRFIAPTADLSANANPTIYSGYFVHRHYRP